MSVHSSMIAGKVAAACAAAEPRAEGLHDVPLEHAIGLSRLFSCGERAMPDIWVAETRRHLGACLTAIETGMRLAIDMRDDVGGRIDAVPEPLLWPTVQSHPALVSPALLAHMRLRAGVSLLLRQAGRGDADTDERVEPDASWPGQEDLAFALAVAEGRWASAGGETQPMRPDLPAEHFAELMWIGGAAFAVALTRYGGVDEGRAHGALNAVVDSTLARHDEASGPIPLADRLVRSVGEDAVAMRFGWSMLERRRLLPFAAIGARRLRVTSEDLIGVLLFGAEEQLVALGRALDGTALQFRMLLTLLKPLRPLLSDAAILRMSDRFEADAAIDVGAMLARLRLPAGLRARIGMLGGR